MNTKRKGAVCYLDAWDVRRGQVIGRSEPKGGIAAFDRLVWQAMTKEPYASARRVFWIVDNGSDHRGQKSIDRLQGRWPTLILVHLPVHASWLNQVEIYHSIIQRKLLDPNDFESTAELARALKLPNPTSPPPSDPVSLEPSTDLSSRSVPRSLTTRTNRRQRAGGQRQRTK